MTVTNKNVSDTYIANGVTTSFAYTFKLLADTDLVVYHDGALKTSGFTVSGIGSPTGGNVVFTTAPSAGVNVFLKRLTTLDQEVSYVPNDRFPAETHERALDRLTLISQELDHRIDRTLKVDEFEEPIGTISKSERSGKILGFDNDGKPFFSNFGDVVAREGKDSVTYINIAAMLADNRQFMTNDVVKVLGYYESGDGGGGDFFLRQGSFTANGATIFAATGSGSNRYWERKFSGSVNLLWSGAKADGVTCCAEPFERAAALGDGVFIPHTSLGFAFVRAAVVPSGISIYGVGPESKILARPVGNYLGVFDLSGVSNVSIHDLYVEGNDVLTTVTGAGSQGGSFVRGGNAKHISIRNCVFDKFKITGASQDTGIIHFHSSAFLQIDKNRWLKYNTGGTDISIAYSVGNVTVTGNHSVSSSDKFVYISTVGSSNTISDDSEISVTSHHVITGNIYLKGEGKGGVDVGRHGIICHYQGGRTHAVISNNILVNGQRHGIYLRGADSDQKTGPSIVSNNIVRYFGGGNTSSIANPSGYNNGIQIESTDGCLIEGNIITDCGYFPDGTARATIASGMGMARQSRNITLSNNFISRCTGHGLSIFPSVASSDGPFNIDKMVIEGNHIREVNLDSIIVALPDDLVKINMLRVTGNVLTSVIPGHKFILINFRIDEPKMLRVSGNILQGFGADQGQFGVSIPNSFISGALHVVENNDFRDIFACCRVGGISTGFHAHRHIGYYTIIRENRAYDCGNFVVSNDTSQRRLLLIDPSNRLYGTTPEPQTVVSQVSRGVYGKCIGKDGDGNPLFEMHLDAPPTELQYYKGDRVVNPNPSEGEPQLWNCIESGSPGIWVPFGVIKKTEDFLSYLASASNSNPEFEVFRFTTLPQNLGSNGASGNINLHINNIRNTYNSDHSGVFLSSSFVFATSITAVGGNYFLHGKISENSKSVYSSGSTLSAVDASFKIEVSADDGATWIVPSNTGVAGYDVPLIWRLVAVTSGAQRQRFYVSATLTGESAIRSVGTQFKGVNLSVI
jgi:hypothetical protein